MKRLHLLAVLILASMAAGAQIYQPAILYGRDESRVNVIKTILIPTGCGTPAVYTGADSAKMKAGIYFDSCNHRAWYYDPKRKAWDSTHLGAVSTGGGSGGSGGGIGAVYAGWGITAVNDSTLKVDSSTLSTYYLRIKDSTIYLTPSDAAALYALSSRTITAGTGLTGGGDLSANRTINADTSVLATKLALVKARDSLQTNINLKADKSTTVSTSAATGLIGGGDLSTNRTHAIDTSIIATKKALANSRDSVQINLNAKADKTTTVSTGTGLTGGGDLSTNRTHSVDTSVIATKLALAKARDSVQTNVNLKADKSTTISAGTGIGSGLGDISSNRTVSVDTSVMLTKLAGVKMRDSVQTNVNAKLNITDTTGKWVSTTYKKAGTDSIFQNKGGTITFLYRVDSVSGGGGSNITDSTLSWVTRNGDSTVYRIATSDTIKSNQGIVHGSVLVGDTATGNKLVAYFFGTSITQNIGTATNREIYWALISDQYNWAPYNKGVSATTLVPASGSDSSSYNRWVAQLPTYNAGIHGAAFIEGGTNDC